MDNELLLFDRLNVIKDTINKYGEQNFYIAYSGGKDSTVLHHLIDMALPDNTIPRVYANTGIEYIAMVKHVHKQMEADNRIVEIRPQTNIKKVLEGNGYPFKSKRFSQAVEMYQRYHELCDEYLGAIERNKELLNDYEYVHNLPKGVRFVVQEYYGVREKAEEKRTYITDERSCPVRLRYLFTSKTNVKISDECCNNMKEKPLRKWQKDNKKPYAIMGIMRDEGGRRSFAKCTVFSKGKLKSFSPLAVITKEWEEWFIKTYNIELCELYKEPYNFKRTGCKGCPFAVGLQDELEVLQKYFPNERKQCEYIWKPVYGEYRRLDYRLTNDEQLKLF
mgnify:CR=1 FL=1